MKTPPLSGFGDVVFANSADGWVLDQPPETDRPTSTTLYLTTDAGQSWMRSNLAGISDITLADGRLFALSRGNAYVAVPGQTTFGLVTRVAGTALGVGGGTVLSYDPLPRGATKRATATLVFPAHKTISMPCRNPFMDAITARSINDFYAVCASEPGAGEQPKTTYQSTDGGSTWRTSAPLPISGYVGALVSTRSALFLDGGRQPLLANRNGSRWSIAVMGEGDAGQTSDLHFTSDAFGWALTGDEPHPLVVTSDGGRTWRSLPIAI